MSLVWLQLGGRRKKRERGRPPTKPRVTLYPCEHDQHHYCAGELNNIPCRCFCHRDPVIDAASRWLQACEAYVTKVTYKYRLMRAGARNAPARDYAATKQRLVPFVGMITAEDVEQIERLCYQFSVHGRDRETNLALKDRLIADRVLAKAETKAKHLELGRAYGKRKYALAKGAGLCTDCMKPSDGGAYCLSCREKNARRLRERRERRSEEAVAREVDWAIAQVVGF